MCPAETEQSAEQNVRTERALELLRSVWGYTEFRPLQEQAVTSVLQGRDSLTVLPTGGGKSLCYQLPALIRDGMAIVVSPLIALMQDQVAAARDLGIAAACVHSGLSPDERREIAGRIRRNELQLLYAAPERLLQPYTLDFLRQVSVSFLAVDEAHCISEWGHDFRPEYRQLADLRNTFPNLSVHAFTATATEQVRGDIVRQLGLQSPDTFVGNFDRPNLTYRIQPRFDMTAQIRAVTDRYPGESGIIYAISRRQVETISARLNEAGLVTRPYHAGLEPDERRACQEAFLQDEVDVIVATVAFGMGIDKSNVRFVIHAEMPRSLESYQQEAGRAGRDGLEAECLLLHHNEDRELWEFLIRQNEGASAELMEQSLARMTRFCLTPACRHAALVRHFGQDYEGRSCGACDVCLDETNVCRESLVTAQKILSCVYRLAEGFGAGYTAQVLRGSRNKRIMSTGHHELSTYGLLKDEAEEQIRLWIRELAAQEALATDPEHKTLSLTRFGWGVLRGEDSVSLSASVGRAVFSGGRRSSTRSAKRDTTSWEGVDTGLFESLRELRTRTAREQGVPSYVVLSDASLRDLARKQPTAVGDLVHVFGIGAAKQERYGEALIECILQWQRSGASD